MGIYTAFNPKGIPQNNKDPDTFSRYPKSGPVDQQGWNVKEITVYFKSIAISAPSSGDRWEANTSQKIKWTSEGSINDVKIQYSTNGGTTWKKITNKTSNDGSRRWTIPDEPSLNCKIKITDYTDDSIYDISDAFTIFRKSIEITSPCNGDSLNVGTSFDIKWTFSGSIEYVDIKYSPDNEATWKDIVIMTANDGIESWTIPDDSSSNCVLKIIDHNDNSIYDLCKTFTIYKITSISRSSILKNFILEQNYPNPFNSRTIIEYDIKESTIVTLKIFNTNGQEIETLINEFKSRGSYQIEWVPKNIPSGIYFYQLKASDFTDIKRLVYLK